MEKLDKAYEVVEMLKTLGLPVSTEQIKAIAMMERQYLSEEVIPQVTKEMEPLVNQMHNKFKLEITYSQENGLDIQVVDKRPVQENLFTSTVVAPKRQRKYIIRVVFPDGHAFCSKTVWETLMEVIKYAGAERVRNLNINRIGDNLVTTRLHSNPTYRIAQKEIEPGLYVSTLSTTDEKYEEIRKINRELNLGLRIEKVML